MRRSRRKDEKSQTDEKFSVHAPLTYPEPALPRSQLQDCGLRQSNARVNTGKRNHKGMPFDQQRRLETPSGATLNLFVKKAGQTARAVVQINHGLSEHAGRYAAFADFLTERGFHVYAQDHRGHGGTKAEDALPGMFARKDGVKKIVADVASVHDLIAREHPGLPVVLFGRSMGGLVALTLLREHARPVAGAALWDYPQISRLSAHAARLLLTWERFRLGSDAPSHFLCDFTADANQAGGAIADGPVSAADTNIIGLINAVILGLVPRICRGCRLSPRRSAFSPAGTTVIASSRADPRDKPEDDGGDEPEDDGVDKPEDDGPPDPPCGPAPTISLWNDMFAMMAELSKSGAFARIDRDLPLYLVGGRGTVALTQRLRRAGFSNLMSRAYPENHDDWLNEPGSMKAMQDFAAWIDRGVLET
jgi:alpha-beta hydrolase superfamily lysophospholipase